MAVAVLPLSVTVSVSLNNSVLLSCVVAEEYRLKVTVSLLLALIKPDTVAESEVVPPTVTDPLDTVVLMEEGTRRSSQASSVGRNPGRRGLVVQRRACAENVFRSQRENTPLDDMKMLPGEVRAK